MVRALLRDGLLDFSDVSRFAVSTRALVSFFPIFFNPSIRLPEMLAEAFVVLHPIELKSESVVLDLPTLSAESSNRTMHN